MTKSKLQISNLRNKIEARVSIINRLPSVPATIKEETDKLMSIVNKEVNTERRRILCLVNFGELVGKLPPEVVAATIMVIKEKTLQAVTDELMTIAWCRDNADVITDAIGKVRKGK